MRAVVLLVMLASCSVRSGMFIGSDATASDDGAPSDEAPTGDAACAQTYTVTKPPSVISFVVDRSGSMADAFGGVTRWEAVRSILVAQGTGFVHRFSDIVTFSATLFDSDAAGLCPDLESVIPNLNNTAQIDALMNTNTPRSGTSVTGDALYAVAAGIDSFAGAKWIVVLSDGEPAACSGSSGVTTAVNAAADTYNKGITTLFVAIGSGLSQATQQQLANAGTGMPTGQSPGAAIWRTSNPTQLAASIEQIISITVPCEFQVSPALDAADVTVTYDGDVLVENDTDGWMRSSADKIILVGSACERFRQRSTPDLVTVHCGS